MWQVIGLCDVLNYGININTNININIITIINVNISLEKVHFVSLYCIIILQCTVQKT